MKNLSIRATKLFAKVFLPKKVIFRGNNIDKVLYITFDDGPENKYTTQILEILTTYNAKATFFVIGKKAERQKEILSNIFSENHLLANHSYSHSVDLHKRSPNMICADVREAETILNETDGEKVHLIRAPWGRINILWMLAAFKGNWKLAHWSYDSCDYTQSGSQKIIERFRKNPVSNGDVILFHDDNSDTVEALKQLIPQWASEGYQMKSMKDFY